MESQRVPLTGDGLVTQRIKADGPVKDANFDAELQFARYRDWQHATGASEQAVGRAVADYQRATRREAMADHDTDRKVQLWLTNLLAFNASTQVQQPAQQQTQEQKQDLEQELKRTRSLGL